MDPGGGCTPGVHSEPLHKRVTHTPRKRPPLSTHSAGSRISPFHTN